MDNVDPEPPSFLALLHEQIRHEFIAHQQYLAIAVYHDQADLPQLAKRCYAQALRERSHALMIIRYLIDKNEKVSVPGIDAVINDFADVQASVALALRIQRQLTDRITALAQAAKVDADYYGEQFIQWFLKEQVEEVAALETLLEVVERAHRSAGDGDDIDLFDVEDFVARELRKSRTAAGPPRAAGES